MHCTDALFGLQPEAAKQYPFYITIRHESTPKSFETPRSLRYTARFVVLACQHTGIVRHRTRE